MPRQAVTTKLCANIWLKAALIKLLSIIFQQHRLNEFHLIASILLLAAELKRQSTSIPWPTYSVNAYTLLSDVLTRLQAIICPLQTPMMAPVHTRFSDAILRTR